MAGATGTYTILSKVTDTSITMTEVLVCTAAGAGKAIQLNGSEPALIKKVRVMANNGNGTALSSQYIKNVRFVDKNGTVLATETSLGSSEKEVEFTNPLVVPRTNDTVTTAEMYILADFTADAEFAKTFYIRLGDESAGVADDVDLEYNAQVTGTKYTHSALAVKSEALADDAVFTVGVSKVTVANKILSDATIPHNNGVEVGKFIVKNEGSEPVSLTHIQLLDTRAATPVYEVADLQVTASDNLGTDTVLTINGVATTVALAVGDDLVGEVATAIVNAYSANTFWTVALKPATTDTVRFTAKTYGNKTDLVATTPGSGTYAAPSITAGAGDFTSANRNATTAVRVYDVTGAAELEASIVAGTFGTSIELDAPLRLNAGASKEISLTVADDTSIAANDTTMLRVDADGTKYSSVDGSATGMVIDNSATLDLVTFENP